MRPSRAALRGISGVVRTSLGVPTHARRRRVVGVALAVGIAALLGRPAAAQIFPVEGGEYPVGTEVSGPCAYATNKGPWGTPVPTGGVAWVESTATEFVLPEGVGSGGLGVVYPDLIGAVGSGAGAVCKTTGSHWPVNGWTGMPSLGGAPYTSERIVLQHPGVHVARIGDTRVAEICSAPDGCHIGYTYGWEPHPSAFGAQHRIAFTVVGKPPDVKTDEERQTYDRAAHVLAGVGIGLGAAGWVFDGIALGTLPALPVAAKAKTIAWVLKGSAIAAGAGAFWLKQLANDPPDEQYKGTTFARDVEIPDFRTGLARLDRALRRLLSAFIAGTTSSEALLISIERAQGAVMAGDYAWTETQLLASAAWARRVAAATRRQVATLRQMSRALPSPLRVRISRSLVSRVRRQGVDRNPSRQMRRLLRQLGFEGSRLQLLRDLLRQAPVSASSGRIDRILRGPSLRSALGLAASRTERLATSLDAAAASVYGP